MSPVYMRCQSGTVRSAWAVTTSPTLSPPACAGLPENTSETTIPGPEYSPINPMIRVLRAVGKNTRTTNTAVAAIRATSGNVCFGSLVIFPPIAG